MLLLGIHSSMMAQAAAEERAPLSSSPWHISADRMQYDESLDEYIAQGHVTLTREGRILTADTIHFNQQTHNATAEGNVRLVSGDDVLTANRLRMNLDSETGLLEKGTLFFSANHLYLSGSQIHKTGEATYTVQDASVTSCDTSNPAWHLTSRNLRVTIEGYGYATHTALWAKRIPVLYTPFLVFPVKLKRQSGLLSPQLGQSDRRGSEYEQPLYWAISDSSDATFYLHSMSLRGLRTGLEYRYVLDEQSMGTLMVDGFNDRKIDDGQGDNSERWGYTDDSALRPNRDRYWLRAKMDQALFWGLKAKLDLDVVSDQDYLHEFISQIDGFNAARRYFNTIFGRDLDDYDDPVRLNRLNLSRIWGYYTFNADLRWYDDVIKRRQEESNDTLQNMPAITFDGIKQPLGHSDFYFDLAASYTHFYREKGTRGQRADLYPRLYYPFYFFQGLTIEPSAGFRQTAWRVDYTETPSGNDRNTQYRAIYDFMLDTSTEFYHIFDFDLAGCDRLKHSITPQVVWEYVPDEDQSEFPQFDALDRIERKNLITYGITNTLTARSPNSGSREDDPAYSYISFLRFKLTQSFDINKQNEKETVDDPEPFSDISAELEFTPARYIAIDADAAWSPYDNHFNSHNAALRLWNIRGDALSVDYRYTRGSGSAAQDEVASLSLSAEVIVNDNWRLRGGYEYNLNEEKEIHANFGLSYKAQCWSVDLDYIAEEANQGYTVMFNLTGLGSIGG